MAPEPAPPVATAPTPQPRPARVPGPTPAPTRLIDGAILVAFLALTCLLGAFPLKDVDFWWHLKTGDLIRSTGEIPHKDVYTYTVPDHDWIDLHWGFQVALSWGYQHLGGVVGLNLAKCAVTAAAVLLLVTARRPSWPIWAMVAAWLPALLLLSGRMYLRPETLTLLYLAAFLAILFRWRERPRLAYLLVPIQILWVNTQGLFVLGPVVLTFALIDALFWRGEPAKVRRRWWRTVLTATALVAAACLANPYGVYGALFPIQIATTMGDPVFRDSIAELTPILTLVERNGGWDNLMLRIHLATVGLGALSFVLPILWNVSTRIAGNEPAPSKSKARKPNRKAAKPPAGWSPSLFRLLLFGSFAALSFQATRNSHQFAAVAGAVTAWNFGEWAAAVAARRSAPAQRWRAFVPRLATLATVGLLIVAVATGGLYAAAGEGRRVGLGEEPAWFPHDAVAFAGRPGMPPRFLGFHMGHAALYIHRFSPDRGKVYLDPRLEVMGPDHFKQYQALHASIDRGDPGFPAALAAAGDPVVLVDHQHNETTGAAMLAGAGGRWRCVWFDPLAAVFLEAGAADSAGAPAVDFLGRHFGRDPSGRGRTAAERLAAAEALGKYALRLLGRNMPELARSLVPLGIDEARHARDDDRQPRAWSLRALLEAARAPGPERPTPQFDKPLDVAVDLWSLRSTYLARAALEHDDGDPGLALGILAGGYAARGMDEAELAVVERLADLSHRTANQARAREQSRARRDQLRTKLGPAPTPRADNRAEVERSIAAFLERGRVETAAELISREFPAPERDWPTADRLATLELHLGRPDRARAAWQSVATPPRQALRSSRIGLTYLIEDQIDPAIASFREALAAEPELFEAAYGLAVAQFDAGRAPEAAAAARLAARIASTPAAVAAAGTLLADVEPYDRGENEPQSRKPTPSGDVRFPPSPPGGFALKPRFAP